MPKGAAPSPEELVELLSRAADELRHTQEQARTAVLALQKEQAAHRETEAELEAAQARAGTGGRDLLLKDQLQIERDNSRALLARVKELETSLQGAATERETLRRKLAEVEAAYLAVGQDQTAKAHRPDDAQLAELAALKAEHQAATRALAEARDTLEDLKLTAEAEQQRVVGLEAAARELADAHERAVRESTEQHERALHEAVEGHQRSLADAEARHTTETAGLKDSLAAAQAELQQLTERCREVERQYEALHREMLLTLEQRDEARRLLDQAKTEPT